MPKSMARELFKSRKFHESIIDRIAESEVEKPVVIVLDLADAKARQIAREVWPDIECVEWKDGFAIQVDEPDFALSVFPTPNPETQRWLDAPAKQQSYLLVFVADGQILVSEHEWQLQELSWQEASELIGNMP